ncbi:MAG: hypothetical protein K8F30_04590, partial [Taibaiella sp.]|nr:hypothetical protein [Taibaiella sp.]
MILAAGAAVSSIILTVVDIPRHVADQSDTKGRFAALRTDIDTFRSLMRIDPNFPLEQFVPKFEGYRKRYSDNYQLLKNDFLGTRGREVKVQKQLNLLLSDKIITETK